MKSRSVIATSLMLLTGLTAAAEGEGAARLVESPLSAANLTSTAVGLIVVLAVMLWLAWVVRRFVQLPGLGKGAVRIVGGVSLGTRERAVLLAVNRRRILVGIAPGQVRTLADLGEDESDPLDAPAAPASTFAQQLGQLVGRHGEDAAEKRS